MTCRIRLTLAAAAFVSLLSCRGDSVSPDVDGPMFAVSDGAHNGNNSFFFLPPLFKMPTVHPGTFNADLRPSVEICDLGIRPTTTPTPPRTCGANVAVFGPGSVVVNTTEQSYHVNWHTDQSHLAINHDYRIRVLVGGAEIGFADVDPVSNGSQLKNVQTNEYIGLVDGRTLPIKFRIEDGALCAANVISCSAGTVALDAGGNVELTVTSNGSVVEVIEVTVEEGTTATFNGQPVSELTFNLEECTAGGIPLDLRPFGTCVQVTTFFAGSGGTGPAELELNNAEFEYPLVVSTCRLEASDELAGLSEEEEGLITLHQQDDVTIRALPHVHPENCGPIITQRSGWQQLRSLAARMFLPENLHAASRSAVINLGAGGGTRVLGTDCTTSGTPSARNVLMAECSATPSAALRSAVQFVGTARTTSRFQFFQPAIMSIQDGTTGLSAIVGHAVDQAPTVKVVDAQSPGAPAFKAYVTFEVVSGGGNFGMVDGQPVTSMRVRTSTDGFAQVPTWVLGTDPEEPNIVVARGRGLAANPPDAKPFVPDIHGANDLVELPTPPDAHTLTFTATALPALGSIEFLQQPTTTLNGEAINPPLRLLLRDPFGNPITEVARVTVGNDPANPASCLVLQVSTLAIEGVAVLDNVRVNGECKGARVAVRAGGPDDFEFPLVFSAPFDIVEPTPTVSFLDQQNLLDGAIGGQGIGRFSDADGSPDPDGTTFDYQDAQTFTAGVSGQLTQIKVPIFNLEGGTGSVTMQIVAVSDGVPDEGHSLGEAVIPVSALSTSFGFGNPESWATFDLSDLGITVVRGQQLAFIVRSTSTVGLIYNPEATLGYDNGVGYRRNRALGATWGTFGQDFGFQTFVVPN